MEVRIRQTQKDGAFHFPLTIEYRFDEKTKPLEITQEITEKDVRFFVPLPARPHLVRVDPAFGLLAEVKEDKGRDWWLAQLNGDPNPILRIRAAEHFGFSKRDPDRKALADALGAEPFWAVQGEISKALGKSGGTVCRDVLLKALSLEHPKARREVVNALGKFKNDETVVSALEGIVRNGDASYAVESDAIKQWAAQRPAGALDMLRPLLSRDSHKEQIRQAVLNGIGEQLDASATDLLLEWTRRGQPRPCRQAALQGLAKLAGAAVWNGPTTDRVVKALQICLDKSEHRSLKTDAAKTLRTLGESAFPALSALQALAEHDPHENVRKQAKETIERIESGAPPQVQLQRLREELKRLLDANRKLSDRIERLESKQPEPAD
jgi:aminopeptidase N